MPGKNIVADTKKNIEKLESENMDLRRKLGEARRDIEAYKRLVSE